MITFNISVIYFVITHGMILTPDLNQFVFYKEANKQYTVYILQEIGMLYL